MLHSGAPSAAAAARCGTGGPGRPSPRNASGAGRPLGRGKAGGDRLQRPLAVGGGQDVSAALASNAHARSGAGMAEGERAWLCPSGPQGFSVRFGGEKGAVGAVLGATELSGGREASPGRQA